MGEIDSFVTQAILASIYVSPAAPGVASGELAELATRCGIGKGELNDFLQASGARLGWNDGKYHGSDDLLHFESTFHWSLDPDHRNLAAFEFVLEELKTLAKHEGMAKAVVVRDVFVALGAAKQLNVHDVQVAITLLAAGRSLVLEGDLVRLTPAGKQYASPREQVAQQDPEFRRSRPQLDLCIHALREIRARNDAGRPAPGNALELFDRKLESLGHPEFRAWWAQVRGELARAEAGKLDLTITVLSAALVEGALALVVRTATVTGRSMAAKRIDPSAPKTWQFEKLIGAAVTGQDR